MTMTAYPGDKIGDHVIITVTVPARYLMLQHHERPVRVPMEKIERLARLDREVDHLGSYEFSWTEKLVMERAGLGLQDMHGGLWPTALLLSNL